MPTNMEGAMRLAEMMARGKLVPTHLQGSAGDCLMVIEQAVRWGMSPFAVAQCTSVVRGGKLMFEGKLVAAAVHTSGILIGRLSYEFSGSGADRKVVASGLMRGEEAPRTVEVSLAAAKTENEHWKKSPDQMLTYHAARVWARRHAPEVMLGVYSPEEFEPQAPRDNFAGTTIEAEPTPQGQPRDTARAIGDEIPERVMEPAPTRPTDAEMLQRIVTALECAKDDAAVSRILNHHEAQHLRDRLQHEMAAIYDKAAADARARVAPPPVVADTPELVGQWPGPDPAQMRA
ncbi:MAG TPA: recombinase RecT, partial [Streptosporangiaceae bacterium]|nr:recombinase RecT [Streptosporangiaceae bacterium]